MRRAIRETLIAAVRGGFIVGMIPTVLLRKLHGQFVAKGRRIG